jgi:long-chain fatty acid transport protein
MSISRTSLAVGVAFGVLVAASPSLGFGFLPAGTIGARHRPGLFGRSRRPRRRQPVVEPRRHRRPRAERSLWRPERRQVDSQVNNNGSTITRPVPPTGLTTPIGGENFSSKPINDGVVPNLAGAFRINDKLAFGLSVAAPYNFTTEYGPRSWTRYDALKSQLTTIDIQTAPWPIASPTSSTWASASAPSTPTRS